MVLVLCCLVVGATVIPRAIRSDNNVARLPADAPATGTAMPFIPPPDSGVVDVAQYGAVGDGRTDDTDALQAAISDNVGKARVLYLPAGTYLVSDTLEWRDGAGKWRPRLTLQGHASDSTTIRLEDGADGFASSASPKAVIYTASGLYAGTPTGGGKDYERLGEGNEAFRNYIHDLTVDTGSANPGAVGIDYLGNNNGAIRNVEVRSGDGTGVAGISMARRWVGPALLERVAVHGFDVGFKTSGDHYSIVMEDVVLTGQRTAGVENNGMAVTVHRLYSEGRGSAVVNGSGGLLVVVDAMLRGNDGDGDAIVNRGGLFARDVRASGTYGSVLDGVDGQVIDTYASRHTAGGTEMLTETTTGLEIPRRRAPLPDDVPVDRWVSVADPRFAGGADPRDDDDDTAALQAALDSGGSTVYLPTSGEADQYLISRTLTVPETVRRIVGLQSTIAALGPHFNDDERPQPMLKVEGGASDPLFVESLRVGAYRDPVVGVVAMLHDSPRTVVGASITLSGVSGYVGSDGAGDVFLRDYCCGTVIVKDARLWAAQLDIETTGSKLKAQNSQVSVLGLKIERAGPVMELSDGSEAEVLGGLLYPVDDVSGVDAAFVIRDSVASLSYIVNAYSSQSNYPTHVAAIGGGAVRTTGRGELPSRGRFGSMVPRLASG